MARREALCVMALLSAVFAAFAEPLTTAAVFYQRDIFSYWHPQLTVFRRAVAEGSWPLWNPYVGFGAPLLADACLQLSYPPTWLSLLLPLPVYYKVFAFGHAFWAGAGAMALCRRLGFSRAPALVAGGAFALAGPFLSALSLFHHYAGASWLPWSLFALEGLVRKPGLKESLALGLVTGLQLLAGSGDMCLAAALLGSFRLAWFFRSATARREGHPILIWGGAAAFLGAALGALQWLPTAALARASFRPGQGAATSTYWSLHPYSIVDFAVPRLLADLPSSPALRQALFEGREPLLHCLYLGLVPLSLAALALLLRAPKALPISAALLFFLLASLGRHTPFYGWLLNLPFFALMRYPEKFLLPAALVLALLAAAGAEALSRTWSPGERRRGRSLALILLVAALASLLAVATAPRVPAFFGALLDGEVPAEVAWSGVLARVFRTGIALSCVGGLLLYRSTRSNPGSALLPLLLLMGAFDQVVIGRGINPLAPRTLFERRPALVDLLQPAAEGSRLHFVVGESACLGLQPAPPLEGGRWRSALAFTEALRPLVGGRFSLFSSFDGEFTGLGPPLMAPVTAAASALDSPAALRMLQVGNVGHVLFLGRKAPPGLHPVASAAAGYRCPVQVLAVPDPLPRAYVAGDEKVVRAAPELVAILADPAFDPRLAVALEEPGPLASSPPEGPPGSAVVTRHRADEVHVRAELGAPGVLILVEAFDGGWKALVDGRPEPVLRANGLFRGVRLAPGRHEVVFLYRPRSVTLGLGLTLAGALALVGLFILNRVRSARSEGARR